MSTFITSRKLWRGLGAYLMVAAAANLAISLQATAGGIDSFNLLVKESLTFLEAGSALTGAHALARHGSLWLPDIAAGIVFLWSINLSLGRTLSGARDEPLAPTLIGEQPE